MFRQTRLLSGYIGPLIENSTKKKKGIKIQKHLNLSHIQNRMILLLVQQIEWFCCCSLHYITNILNTKLRELQQQKISILKAVVTLFWPSKNMLGTHNNSNIKGEADCLSRITALYSQVVAIFSQNTMQCWNTALIMLAVVLIQQETISVSHPGLLQFSLLSGCAGQIYGTFTEQEVSKFYSLRS